jgi:hypothetical protein
MFIDLPDDELLYNRHWVVAVSVVAKPGSTGNISLALKPIYYLETESREVQVPGGGGAIELAPSVLACDQSNETIGPWISCDSLRIRNGSDTPRLYRVFARGADQNISAKLKTALSPGYFQLPRDQKISLSDSSFRLAPNEIRQVRVRVARSEDGKLSKKRKYEFVIDIETAMGDERFARGQID